MAGQIGQSARLLGVLLILGLILTACSTRLSPFPKTEEHIVGSGDTLYSIAFEHDLDYRNLAKWNGIESPYRIYTGQMLVLHPYHHLARNNSGQRDESGEADKPREKKVETKPIGQRSRAAEVRMVEAKPTPPPDSSPAEGEANAAAAESEPAPEPDTAAPPEPDTAAPAEPDKVAKAEPAVSPRQAPKPVQVIPKYDDPWIWPVRGKVIDSFSDKNKGIDISGRFGEPIRATAAGKVVYAGEGLKGYGLLLIVKHDDDYLSAYGHNHRLMVVQGEAVKQGQHIAELGRGPESQPMVHFEIRRHGKPVDPVKLLPK